MSTGSREMVTLDYIAIIYTILEECSEVQNTGTIMLPVIFAFADTLSAVNAFAPRAVKESITPSLLAALLNALLLITNGSHCSNVHFRKFDGSALKKFVMCGWRLGRWDSFSACLR